MANGAYPCQTTLHVKDGKVIVVVHDTFGLAVGSSIPLLRSEHDLVIEPDSGAIAESLGFLNGHGII